MDLERNMLSEKSQKEKYILNILFHSFVGLKMINKTNKETKSRYRGHKGLSKGKLVGMWTKWIYCMVINGNWTSQVAVW